MPNWCYNALTISHEDETKVEELKNYLTENEGKDVATHFYPNPTGEWDYGWSCENWGTKWDFTAHDWSVDGNTVTMNFDTAWSPPTTLYDYLTEQGWHVSGLYEEPGMGFCGEYDDGHDVSYEYNFEDPDWADNIPEHVRDFANLDNAYEDWKEWQEEESTEEDE